VKDLFDNTNNQLIVDFIKDIKFLPLCITLFIPFYLSSKPWLYLTLLFSLFSVFLLIVVTLVYDYFLFSRF